jgi:hypothetical protein
MLESPIPFTSIFTPNFKDFASLTESPVLEDTIPSNFFSMNNIFLFSSDVTVDKPIPVTSRSKSGTLLVFAGFVENPIPVTSRSISGDSLFLLESLLDESSGRIDWQN